MEKQFMKHGCQNYGKEQADIKMAEFKGKQSINSSGKK